MNELTEQLRASVAREKRRYKKYTVTLDAEWRGCTTVVMALSEADALNRVARGEFGKTETRTAELVNWHARKADRNE